MKPIDKLAVIARGWGGAVLAVDSVQYSAFLKGDGIYEAPFTEKLAVDWKNKQIYHVNRHWADVIHEMGHVFASKTDPNSCSEFDFFGWELMLARKVGPICAWVKRNANYIISDQGCEDLGDLDPVRRKALLRERIATARDLGLVVGDEPIAVR